MREEKVILDSDLAGFYAVSTKRLNEQVKRNRSRFPNDFVFQLTQDEKIEVVAKYVWRDEFSGIEVVFEDAPTVSLKSRTGFGNWTG